MKMIFKNLILTTIVTIAMVGSVFAQKQNVVKVNVLSPVVSTLSMFY